MPDIICSQGKPENVTDRLRAEQDCYRILEQLEIPFLRADHPAAYTMEECARIGEALHTVICKNLFLCNTQKTKFYLLMMEDRPFKTKVLSRQLGIARLSFAPEEKMAELLGTTPGSASVLGLMYDKDNAVQLVIDRPVAEGETVGMHPCINTSSLCVKTADILQRFLPAVHHTPVYVDLFADESSAQG